MKKLSTPSALSEHFSIPAEATDFLKHLDRNTPNGRYDFSPDCYVNVMEIMTLCEFADMEAHREFIDVQLVIDGEERIYYADIAALTVTTPYAPANDCAFYAYDTGTPFVDLTNGEGVILAPSDAHLPCRAVKSASLVKKAVFKIRCV